MPRPAPSILLTAAALGAGLFALRCHPPPGLSSYCPDDPMARDCPGGSGCSGPYECVAYCIRHYPDRMDVPDDGPGSWCDDRRRVGS